MRAAFLVRDGMHTIRPAAITDAIYYAPGIIIHADFLKNPFFFTTGYEKIYSFGVPGKTFRSVKKTGPSLPSLYKLWKIWKTVEGVLGATAPPP